MDNGVVTEIGGERVLRFERRLRHPVERVWSALTEPAELVKWLAEAEVDLREGGRVHLRWLNTDDEGNHAVSDGTISQLEPPRLIEYGSSNHGRLRWELEEAERRHPAHVHVPATARGVPLARGRRLAHPPRASGGCARRPARWTGPTGTPNTAPGGRRSGRATWPPSLSSRARPD